MTNMFQQKKNSPELEHTIDNIIPQAPDYIGAHRIKHAHNFYFICV